MLGYLKYAGDLQRAGIVQDTCIIDFSQYV